MTFFFIRLFNMSSGVNISKNTVKRIKQGELQLNYKINKINSSLAESLHEINNTVRAIEQEQFTSPNDFKPYYLRRRNSTEHSMHAYDPSSPNEPRERASSFGSHSIIRSPVLSATHSRESVGSEDSAGKRDVSPLRRTSRKSHSLHHHHDESPGSSLSQFYQFNRMKSRRNSLPMSFSLQNSHDFHAHSRDSSEQGVNMRLRRVEHELSHRKPKSIRQLSATSMTSIDERKENEKNELDKRRQAAEEYFGEVQGCTYLRSKTADMKTLSVEEIFQK